MAGANSTPTTIQGLRDVPPERLGMSVMTTSELGSET